MHKRFLVLAAALSTSVIQAAPVLGAECLGQQFPDSIKVGTNELLLNGMGIRKATMFQVKVYVAGLYLPKKSRDGARILSENQPWKLVLRFVHDADASDIRDAFDDGFEKAAGDKVDALRTRISALKDQMTDFRSGYFLSYAYDPGMGTVVDVNGTTGRAIAGADFATALLKISIGPEPPNEDLKAGLLGGDCE